MPTPEARPWQVRLLDSTGSPMGGGVLVDERHVVTCAHVVREALGVDDPAVQAPAEVVRVDFVRSESAPVEATVEAWADVAEDGRADVAVLALSEPAPVGSQPAPVRRSDGVLGHDFDVLGFPRGYDEGLSASGTIRRPAGGGGDWVELSVRTGTLVARGFSGSPVFDEELGAVVGIIVGADKDRENRAAWMIPVSRLSRYWPALDDVVRHWSMYPPNEFISHWSPRSRGVERHSSRGSFFTGRRQAMKELSDWLANGPADGRVRAVTGGPGSGKSAVLARLAVLADPLVRPLLPDRPEEPAPLIDVAVHARGKSAAEVLAAIASAVGMPPSSSETWVDDLVSRGRPLTVLVDALDESAEPMETATLLRRTAAVGAEGRVKVLVGTRLGYEEELRHQLGARTVVLDLDVEPYLDRADLADYVHSRLTSGGAAYDGAEEPARQVAEVIATRSYPSFLLAQLSTSALAVEGRVDLDVEGWESRFAESVADGWHDYLDRFGDRRRQVQDLLLPLAYAQGTGLGTGDDLWPSLASALSGRRYEARDVEWLLEHAAAYLVQELVQDDRAVYRLYHQTLVEHLRRVTREPEVWRRFARHLIDEVPRRADGLPDWTRARAYTLAHLPTHAAAAGLLGELASDPLFLATADRDQLARVLRAATDEQSLSIVPAYLAALPELGPSVDDNLNHLALAAHLIGPRDLVERVDRLDPKVPLRVLWATPTSTVRSHYLAGAAGGVAAVAPVVVDRRSCLAVCALDGTIRIWDADGYAPRGPELAMPGHYGSPFLAAATIGGRSVVVTGRQDTIYVVDLLVAGRDTITPEVVASISFDDASVTAAAVSVLRGAPMVAVGFHDGVIQLRHLDHLEEEVVSWQIHEGPVLSVQLAGDDVVSAGADGGISWLTVNQEFEISELSSTGMEDATWVNEARLIATSEDGAVLTVGFADGTLGWWPDGAAEPSNVVVASAPAFGTYVEVYDGSLITTTTTGSDMKTLEAAREAERRRRREARDRARMDPEPIEIGERAEEVAAEPGGDLPVADEDDDNFRVLTLRAGVTSVDAMTIESRLLLAAGGYDGRVVLVESGGELHELQSSGPPVSTVRFVNIAGRLLVVASDRGAGGGVHGWEVSSEGVPVSGDVGALGALPEVMWTVDNSAGNRSVLTWGVGQDVAIRDLQTGAARMLGTDLAERAVLDVIVGRSGEEDVAVALIEEGASDGQVRAWWVETGGLMADQHLAGLAAVTSPYLADGRLVAQSFDDESRVLTWGLEDEDPAPEAIILRREGASVWGSDEVPELQGGFRRVPGGPPQLVFAVGDTWKRVVLVDLDQGTARVLNDEYSSSEAATATMLGGRAVVLEASGDVIEVSAPTEDPFAPERIATLSGVQTEAVTVLRALAEATLVVSGGVDGSVRVWHDLSPEPDVLALHSPVRDLEIAEDHTIIVLCNRGLVALHPTPSRDMAVSQQGSG
ncbi:trypsin-like peptidase domain-containing protein [Microbacterium sp. ZW T2_14]|uniref:serine protease n=1 Tax=Microbacterium sp. ZW T2_14 TaxID=3378079 RepID=UPI0038537395